MRAWLSCLVVVAAAGVVSCGEETPTEPQLRQAYGDLTNQDHVLGNLALAYTRRDIAEVRRLLEPDYTFCHQPAGGFKCWNRDEELLLTAALFGGGKQAVPAAPAAGATIAFTTTSQPWVKSTTGDPDRQEDDILYERTVLYQISGDGGAANGSATFIIRQHESAGPVLWYIFGIFDHAGHWAAVKSRYEESGSDQGL